MEEEPPAVNHRRFFTILPSVLHVSTTNYLSLAAAGSAEPHTAVPVKAESCINFQRLTP
jgi:hypothetical protein